MHKHTNHQHFNKYDQMKLIIACKLSTQALLIMTNYNKPPYL